MDSHLRRLAARQEDALRESLRLDTTTIRDVCAALERHPRATRHACPRSVCTPPSAMVYDDPRRFVALVIRAAGG